MIAEDRSGDWRADFDRAARLGAGHRLIETGQLAAEIIHLDIGLQIERLFLRLGADALGPQLEKHALQLLQILHRMHPDLLFGELGLDGSNPLLLEACKI